MEAVISGLFVVAIAGLTTLAFKRHPGYRRLANVVTMLIIALILGGAIWDNAMSHAYRTAAQFVELDKQLAAMAALYESRPPIWAMVAAFALIMYVQSLEFIVLWLTGDEPAEKDAKEARRRGRETIERE